VNEGSKPKERLDWSGARSRHVGLSTPPTSVSWENGAGRLYDGALGDVLASRQRRRFVGRIAELELVRAALDAAEPPFSVLWLNGPGGIGKTSLLDVIAEQARQAAGSASTEQARREVARFIDAYNHRRRHSSCEMLPLVAYEALLAERAVDPIRADRAA
jgi:transposase InsO family protein